MLVLSRRPRQSIMIGDIEVVVVELQPGKVRLGVTAPVDVPVHRREVYDAFHVEGKQFIKEHKNEGVERETVEVFGSCIAGAVGQGDTGAIQCAGVS